MIRVLRQYQAYAVRDSTHLECSWKITLEVSGQDYALLPVPDYLADLQVQDGRGEELVVIPDGVFEKMSGIDRDALREAMLGRMVVEVEKNGGSAGGVANLARYRILPIMLGDRGGGAADARYETITLRWIRPMSFDKSRGLTLRSTFTADIVRHGFSQSAGSSMYVSIRLGRGLRFAFAPSCKPIVGALPPVRVIMSNEADHTVRLGWTEHPVYLVVSVKCTVHPAMEWWSALGVAIGLVVPALLLLAARLGVGVNMSFEMLAGTVALLMAFRWFVFEDLPIMQRWQWLILVSVAINVVVLFALHVPWNQVQGAVAAWLSA